MKSPTESKTPEEIAGDIRATNYVMVLRALRNYGQQVRKYWVDPQPRTAIVGSEIPGQTAWSFTEGKDVPFRETIVDDDSNYFSDQNADFTAQAEIERMVENVSVPQ